VSGPKTCGLILMIASILSTAQCTRGLSTVQTPTPQNGSLTVVFPLETTEVRGGQAIRVSISLVDQGNQPIEMATVQAELWAPSGEAFATLVCVDTGQGRYLSDYVQLPLRGAGGTWRVVAQATWMDGGQAQGERTFTGIPFLSETYQSRYGFWVEPPRLFGYNVAMYNLHNGGLHFEDRSYEDGGGYVLLDNYRYETVKVTFATLDVHWGPADFPTDAAAAIARIQDLAGPYRQDPETPTTELEAESTLFQDRPAWRVTGRWKAFYAPNPTVRYPVEWTIFRCPDSDWLWTLAIYAEKTAYMDHLREVRGTFECPLPE
jgi:hypothetical protein